jgi:hypothetical protein
MIDSTVSDLDDLIRASAAVRKPHEGDAYLNLAFFSGNQWMSYDGEMLFEPQLEDWRSKVTDNRIRPNVRTEIAKMTKTRPQWVGVPKSQSDTDIAGARYAEDVLDDAWHSKNMLRKLRAALEWSRVCKAGFWKIWWDPSIGDPRDILVYGDGHELAGKLVRDQNGGPFDPAMMDQMPTGLDLNMVKKSVSPGDYRIDIRSFFEMYPDPHAGEDGLSGAEWCGEEAVYTRDYVRRHLNEFYDELKFDTNPNGGIAESRWPALAGANISVPDIAKGVKLREYWDERTHVIWTQGGKILVEEDNPYGWIPYVMFSGMPVPGRFWPDCTVDDLRPRQVDLNNRLSQIDENARRIGNPPIVVPSSMGDDWQWNGLPGETVFYQDNGSPNAKPAFMQVPEMPAYVQNDVDRILSSMMDISGQHEVSAGQVPAGITAASAISQLQEADDTRLGPDISDMEEALSEAGTRILDLVDKYYDQDRLIKVSGPDGAWDVAAFKENMLKGMAEIQVQAGSGMPQSKAAKQAAIQQILTMFIQNGVPLGEKPLRKVLGEFEVGGLEQFFASQQRDESQINDENRRLAGMLEGEMPINAFDDDQAHIDGHTDFQKTARYQQLPPPTQAIIDAHVASHRERVLTAASSQAPPGALPGMPPAPAAVAGGEPGPSTSTSPMQSLLSPSTTG